MHGDVNFPLQKLPASWGQPRFQFGDRVKVLEGLEAALGTIRGFYWSAPSDWECIHEGATPGWWYVIATDEDDPSYRVWPSMMIHEGRIESYLPVVQLQYAQPRSA